MQKCRENRKSGKITIFSPTWRASLLPSHTWIFPTPSSNLLPPTTAWKWIAEGLGLVGPKLRELEFLIRREVSMFQTNGSEDCQARLETQITISVLVVTTVALTWGLN